MIASARLNISPKDWWHPDFRVRHATVAIRTCHYLAAQPQE